MKCRENCAACCIAPSISSFIPGMEKGKKAGERCIQLSSLNQCKLFNSKDRPRVCGNLQPSEEMCKGTREEALFYLSELQKQTEPDKKIEKDLSRAEFADLTK